MTISGTELAQLGSITYRQLDYWVRCDVLEPLERPHQSGFPREFPETEVQVARAVGQLRILGAPLDVLREVAGQLRTFTPADWHGVIFVDQVGLIRRDTCALCWTLDLALVAA